jgi:hypothetical protein
LKACPEDDREPGEVTLMPLDTYIRLGKYKL